MTKQLILCEDSSATNNRAVDDQGHPHTKGLGLSSRRVPAVHLIWPADPAASKNQKTPPTAALVADLTRIAARADAERDALLGNGARAIAEGRGQPFETEREITS